MFVKKIRNRLVIVNELDINWILKCSFMCCKKIIFEINQLMRSEEKVDVQHLQEIIL